MRSILKFKHWQLFLLIVICGAWTSPSPLKEFINSISFITFTVWIYAIGVYGQEKIEALGLPTLNLKLFKANIILIPIFIVLIYFIIPEEQTDNFTLRKSLLIPISIYLVFAIFQTIIFACKTLAIVELKREVSFSDYVVNLILVLFLLIGIWILQPKVRKFIASNEIIAIE